MLKSLTFAVAMSVATFNMAHAGSYHECPISIRKAMNAELQGNFVLAILADLSDSYYKTRPTEYKWWNEIRRWYSHQSGGVEYIPFEVQAATFKMAAGAFYEQVGREEPYIKAEIALIDADETPSDMDRHLQTQADRIEFEMNKIQQSWIESSEKEDPEHPSHHKSLSDTAIKAVHRIRSVGTLADAYRATGTKRPDER